MTDQRNVFVPDQLLLSRKNGPVQSFLPQNTRPDLRLIEPEGRSRSKVKSHIGMCHEPVRAFLVGR